MAAFYLLSAHIYNMTKPVVPEEGCEGEGWNKMIKTRVLQTPVMLVPQTEKDEAQLSSCELRKVEKGEIA